MKIVEVSSDCTVTLPKNMVKPSEKVIILIEGNTIVIKKLEPPRLSAIARRARGRSLSMPEIAREVQAYRKGASKR